MSHVKCRKLRPFRAQFGGGTFPPALSPRAMILYAFSAFGQTLESYAVRPMPYAFFTRQLTNDMTQVGTIWNLSDTTSKEHGEEKTDEVTSTGIKSE
jgi:hypothetical protein